MLAHAQQQTQPPAPIVEATPVAEASPAVAQDLCCGSITPDGKKLAAFIDSMDVEHHWLNHHRIDWKSGNEERSSFQLKDTHCSAFAAAVSYRLHVYLLRPPEHSQEQLANAQGHWLSSERARSEGWVPVDMAEAQRRANLGEFVTGVYVESDPRTHGHIVVIRPAEKTSAELAQDGPQDAMAGVINYSSRPIVHSFGSHPNAWPDGIRYYAHKIPWSRLKAGAPLPDADDTEAEAPQDSSKQGNGTQP
jgi:hypothetical protein